MLTAGGIRSPCASGLAGGSWVEGGGIAGGVPRRDKWPGGGARRAIFFCGSGCDGFGSALGGAGSRWMVIRPTIQSPSKSPKLWMARDLARIRGKAATDGRSCPTRPVRSPAS